METGWLIWSSLFSLVGAAALMYGRRRQLLSATVFGIALMIYPYFVSSTGTLVGIGALLIAGMFLGHRWEGTL